MVVLKLSIWVIIWVIVFIISWFISALLLVPCALLTIASNFQIDYHHRFHLYWARKVLVKRNSSLRKLFLEKSE